MNYPKEGETGIERSLPRHVYANGKKFRARVTVIVKGQPTLLRKIFDNASAASAWAEKECCRTAHVTLRVLLTLMLASGARAQTLTEVAPCSSRWPNVPRMQCEVKSTKFLLSLAQNRNASRDAPA